MAFRGVCVMTDTVIIQRAIGEIVTKAIAAALRSGACLKSTPIRRTLTPVQRGITMTASLSERVRRTSLKSQRLMARISDEQKSLLQRAAEIRGQTLT